jgi:hypothetical protein
MNFIKGENHPKGDPRSYPRVHVCSGGDITAPRGSECLTVQLVRSFRRPQLVHFPVQPCNCFETPRVESLTSPLDMVRPKHVGDLFRRPDLSRILESVSIELKTTRCMPARASLVGGNAVSTKNDHQITLLNPPCFDHRLGWATRRTRGHLEMMMLMYDDDDADV